MLGEAIRSLYRYNAWANARILDTAERLDGARFASVRDTLVHTMSAQWLWLERWNGRSPRTVIEAPGFPDVASIRARWAGIELGTQAFVAGLTEPPPSSTTIPGASAGRIRSGSR